MMLDQEQAAKFYKRKQIESATPGQLVLLLYDGAIDHINRAELAMADLGPETIEKFHNHLISCQNIVTELIVSLDMEQGGAIAQNLFRLYEYINHRLVRANINKSLDILKEVKELLNNLKSAWAQVIEKESSQARPRQNLGLNLQG